MVASDNLKIRSFISLPISDQVRDMLRKTIKELDGVIQDNIRWVRPEGIHLTLKFMGDIDSNKIEALLLLLPEITTEFAPFELTLSELGCFPNNRRPRVLWAGVKGNLSILQDLHLALDNVVNQVGLPRERRSFSPHLTLGRVRRNVSESEVNQIGQIIGSTSLPDTPSWTNRTVDLMRTELDPEGSRHYLVGSFPMLS
ncbi:MAG: RNA 2',3'-cyclic phosphodiesterase [Chloroflexota bacterium]|nr:RNA 2',3'-cyclic phosphodiesterase [Chloroflexota bacterium]